MDYKTIEVELSNHVATVTLNRPEKLNPLGGTTVRELLNVCDEVEQSSEVRVVVLTGAGRAFCVGLDVEDVLEPVKFSIAEHERLVRLYNSVVLRLKYLELPTIAAVNGYALGAGFALAIACDIRIASEKAKTGAIFVQRGASAADMGTTWILPRLVGPAHAAELMLTGDIIDAARGEHIGLFNRVVPPEKLMQVAQETAAKLADGPPLGLKFTKRALRRSVWEGLQGDLDYESAVQSLATLSDDFQEGWKSFVEKRPPEFKGR
jgi:2-(1,2-epoxy-1,2-dihydrophenyl)acetyl-CoA isomerase